MGFRHEYTGLYAGDLPIQHDTFVLESGQDLTRGAVLGRKATGGKLVLSLAAANDGSEKPIAILADDVDASSGDITCAAYVAGEFFASECTLGAGHTVASVTAAWRDEGRQLFLRTSAAAA
ncbi:MAG: head decoration protein [Pseudomonadota bacterium]